MVFKMILFDAKLRQKLGFDLGSPRVASLPRMWDIDVDFQTEAPLIDDENPICQRHGFPNVMRDQKHGRPVLAP